MGFIEIYPKKIPTLGDGDVTNGRRGPHGHRNDVNVARDSEKEKYGVAREPGSASICRVLITFDPFSGLLDQCSFTNTFNLELNKTRQGMTPTFSFPHSML